MRNRLTYANVMSTLAVFLMLGGTAVAAKKIRTKDMARGAVTKSRIATGAVNANKLAKNSVTTAKLRNNSVIAAKIPDRSLPGNKLRNGTITSVNLAPGSVTTNAIADGGIANADLAPKVVTSGKIADRAVNRDQLAKGVIHAAELGAVHYRESPLTPLPAESSANALSHCNPGELLLGGGFDVLQGNSPPDQSQVLVLRSRPTPQRDGWQVHVRNALFQPLEIVAYAICLEA